MEEGVEEREGQREVRDRYDCPLCPGAECYASLAQFERHMWSRHLYARCPHCPNLYRDVDLDGHVEDGHPEYHHQFGPYQACQLCGRPVPKSNLAQHVRLAHRINCPVCPKNADDEGFLNEKRLYKHLTEEHGFIRCDGCQPANVFVSPSDVSSHNEKFHTADTETAAAVNKRKHRHDSSHLAASPKKCKVELEAEEHLDDEVDLFPNDEPPREDSSLLDLDDQELGSDGDNAVDVSKLTEGEYCVPSKLDKDPLKGFWFSTIMECLACPDRPSKKFQSANAWNGHLKNVHGDEFKGISQYKQAHGDPDLLKLRHNCHICRSELILNHGVVIRHLKVKHNLPIAEYQERFREKLLKEKAQRPRLPSAFSLEGWWEGCLYTCALCQETLAGVMAFENHLSFAHSLIGPKAVKEYQEKYKRLCTLNRKHQCYECGRLMKHEYKYIFHHLSRHKMDLESYAKKHLDKLKEELVKKRMEYVIEKDAANKTIVSLSEYLEARKQEEEQQQTFDPMDEWFDGSEHECKLCRQVFYSNLKFHSHIKKRHNIVSTKEYRATYGDPEKVLRQHKCQICGSLIKWEACRIRDHLRLTHKDPYPVMSLKEYGEKFKDYILDQVLKFKSGANTSPEANNSNNSEESAVADKENLAEKSGGITGRRRQGEPPESGYTQTQWKTLHQRKHFPSDKLDCPHCQNKISRHSMKRHIERMHMGIFNTRDLERLKRRQMQLAKQGIVRSMGELMRSAGGRKVIKGKVCNKAEVTVDEDMFRKYKRILDNAPASDIESRINLIKSGLSWQEIETKLDLLNSGLRIQKVRKTPEKLESDQEKLLENFSTDGQAEQIQTVTLLPTSDSSQSQTFSYVNIDAHGESLERYIVDQETGEIVTIKAGQVLDNAAWDELQECVASEEVVVDSGQGPVDPDTTSQSHCAYSSMAECVESTQEFVVEIDNSEDRIRTEQIVNLRERVIQVMDCGQESEEAEVFETDEECEENRTFLVTVDADETYHQIPASPPAFSAPEMYTEPRGQVIELHVDGEHSDSMESVQVVAGQNFTEEIILGDPQAADDTAYSELPRDAASTQSVEVTDSRPADASEEDSVGILFVCDNSKQEIIYEPVVQESGEVVYLPKEGSDGGGAVIVEEQVVTEDSGWRTLNGQHGIDPLDVEKKAVPNSSEYDRKCISRTKVEADGKVSQGTLVCYWTKMPGDRVRVASNRVVYPSSGPANSTNKPEPVQQTSSIVEKVVESEVDEAPADRPPKKEAASPDISSSAVFPTSRGLVREIGCQVTPHHVSGLLTNQEDERLQKEDIIRFLGSGGTLDKICPGCGKCLSRLRNLISHIETIHGVRVVGDDQEDTVSRWMKENERQTCNICHKTLSRKSMRRHLRLNHSDLWSQQN